MQYGITLAGMGADVGTIPELAYEAEQAGWDGVFIWDEIFGADPWVLLTAIAMRTKRIRMGALLTPLSRRRPWKLASETATLDNVSNGRLILIVGLGAVDAGFENVREETDRKTRAAMLDEGLEILTGMWREEAFTYQGEYYRVQDAALTVRLIQSPRIPIWVVGAWPRKKSMQRVIRFDGILPEGKRPDGTSFNVAPDDIREIQAYIMARRSQSTPFDIVVQNESPGHEREQVRVLARPWAEAGVTWWIENPWASVWIPHDVEGLRTRIRQGPPRLDG